MSSNTTVIANQENVKEESGMKINFKFIGLVIGLLAFIYVYPRVLVNLLGEGNPWTSYLYLYGFGLIFFTIGIWVIRSSGALVLGRGHDSFWYKILLGGFVFFASLHGLWIFLALNTPVKS